ncbi:MAG: 2,4-dihydroxyhept-2-ene-1,7-dioic acid aldolase [Rhodospirillum sp.]|nr:2,4-dihydroxyhept-2-ene-1,7-dioic acid aldolase [Rhodospirillum sp.]MCF8491224.1 2,4-dihydroxyhept-2-ene-1,7-dioic acid aldolase [Rhodospirillum sp.]MCF8500870.1 2,4-dihydroxyhept-2-ene-1,7-dioic acid aldolase [Rhodospirillum sp.]
MRANAVRLAWEEGRQVVSAWIGIPNPLLAEFFASHPVDAVIVDMQHGMNGTDSMLAMLQGITAQNGPTPFVRLPWNTPAETMKALDGGALGVICPMIDTAEEAATFVANCRYFPRGRRSVGPPRAILAHGADYMEKADDEVIALAMIETLEGLENVDAIAATPELDGLFMGPGDLARVVTGKFGLNLNDPDYRAAVMRILEAGHRAGKKVGTYAPDTAFGTEMLELGFDLVTMGADSLILGRGISRELEELNEVRKVKG